MENVRQSVNTLNRLNTLHGSTVKTLQTAGVMESPQCTYHNAWDEILPYHTSTLYMCNKSIASTWVILYIRTYIRSMGVQSSKRSHCGTCVHSIEFFAVDSIKDSNAWGYEVLWIGLSLSHTQSSVQGQCTLWKSTSMTWRECLLELTQLALSKRPFGNQYAKGYAVYGSKNTWHPNCSWPSNWLKVGCSRPK